MIYMFLAEGFEEIEALATLDILRRADIETKTVGIGGEYIKGAHNITVKCDLSENEAETNLLSGIILPGGMPGTLNLEKSSTVNKFIDFASQNSLLIAAICAAPSILGHKGLLKGKKAVCYPGFEKELIGAEVLNIPHVTDGNIITARGAGAAFYFGFSIVDFITGSAEKADNLSESMICK